MYNILEKLKCLAFFHKEWKNNEGKVNEESCYKYEFHGNMNEVMRIISEDSIICDNLLVTVHVCNGDIWKYVIMPNEASA